MPAPDSKNPRPIVILGPTAGGKSELAVMLAERCKNERGAAGQVIGADSMQIYRQMDAGTAKPSSEQRARAVHHLIDIVEPTERFTVADWLALADELLETLPWRGVTPIVVGGTNLYMKALLEGMFEGPPVDEELRAALRAQTNEQLRERLLAIDEAAAERIHFNDRKRTIRAIEVFEQTGQRISDLQTQWDAESPTNGGDSGERSAASGQHSGYRHNPILIGLHWPVEAINPRINLRVKEMFFPGACGLSHESLPDETRRLEAAGLLGPQARKALGYQQALDAFAGRGSLDDAFEQTKILTRRFAKTQRTWLKRFTGVHWLPASTLSPTDLAEAAWQAIRAA